ncbi:hypothetical protein CEXT_729701 [Caerostris extrusa]|uniref:Uncharacterized protein n=1 Tax=Caerostris extrusa TaxID=172846 RepID=A0AAV4R1D5_CAEEX|nr:hypothetical protein CEXT_729701 [Caerostris extrusa]
MLCIIFSDPNSVFIDEDEEVEDRDSTRYSPVSWTQYDRLHQRYIFNRFEIKMRTTITLTAYHSGFI